MGPHRVLYIIDHCAPQPDQAQGGWALGMRSSVVVMGATMLGGAFLQGEVQAWLLRQTQVAMSGLESSLLRKAEDVQLFLDQQVWGLSEDRFTRGSRAMASQKHLMERWGGLSQQEKVASRKSLAYGEFPIASLAELLLGEPGLGRPLSPDDVFVDVGSGCGRLVLAVAMLYDRWRYCAGIEILPELHKEAVEAQARALELIKLPHAGVKEAVLQLRPCLFVQGDLESVDQTRASSPIVDPLREATVLFCYSTSFRSSDGLYLADSFSRVLAGSMRKDAIVVSTDKRFSCEYFDLVHQVTVPNPEVLESICYYHRPRQR